MFEDLKSLFGPSHSSLPPGILGQYYDPKEMRRQMIANMLMLGGVGMMGNSFQGAAQGVAQAAMDTPRQYRDMAKDAYEADMQAKDQAWQDEQRGRQREQWGYIDNLMQGVNDPLARAFPEQYAETQFNNKYGPHQAPEAPKVETFYDQKTGQQYKAQWDANTGNWVRIGGAKAESNGVTIGPDGTVQIGGQKTTEADRRAMLLASQTATQEPAAMAGFDELASLKNTAASSLPGGRYFMSPKAQQAQDALSNVIGNWLYLTSGATANPGELKARLAEIVPTAMDDERTVALKKARLQSIFDEMKRRAGLMPQGTPGAQPVPAPIGGSDGYSIEEIP